MQTISFDVSGMTCGGCSGNVQRVTPVQIESAIAKLGNTTNVRPADYDGKAQP